MHQVDVAIIGGGALGICTAHYLCTLGRRVAVIEKGEVAAGSSYGNAGMIVPSHSVPLAEPGVIGQGLKWMLISSASPYIRRKKEAVGPPAENFFEQNIGVKTRFHAYILLKK